jgi:hypothetical protein
LPVQKQVLRQFDLLMPSTRSVGMSLARPPKAGIEEVLVDLRRVSDD